jgi:SAM-dependent methyltransferase
VQGKVEHLPKVLQPFGIRARKVYWKIRIIRFEFSFRWISALSKKLIYPKHGIARYQIDNYIQKISKKVKPNELVLDVGAGYQPYKNLFNHCNYETCDYKPILHDVGYTKHKQTFYCDIANHIPRPENHYDTIICTQVLEHVKNPQKVICESYRILKPGGKLFLTVPQSFGVHQAPHNYFNFLKYGLEHLFHYAGFTNVLVKPLGGIFHLLSKVQNNAFMYLLSKISRLNKILFYPIIIIIQFFLFILSYVYFHLDKLDKEQTWTIHYGCYCIK